MGDAIVIGTILLATGFGVWSMRRHFKGEGGCCGGSGSYRPKKKKLSHVTARKLFSVETMHCEKCKYRVEEIIADLDGVAGEADWKRGELVVSYEQEVNDDIIKEQLERAGYRVTQIDPL